MRFENQIGMAQDINSFVPIYFAPVTSLEYHVPEKALFPSFPGF